MDEFDELIEGIKKQGSRPVVSYHNQQTTSTERTEQPHKQIKSNKNVVTNKDGIRKSKDGHFRRVNPQILESLFSDEFVFSASEMKVVLYVIWSITSDKSRNYINVKKITIQQRTGLSKSTVRRVINSLVHRNILRTTDNPNLLVFNSTVENWK